MWQISKFLCGIVIFNFITICYSLEVIESTNIVTMSNKGLLDFGYNSTNIVLEYRDTWYMPVNTIETPKDSRCAKAGNCPNAYFVLQNQSSMYNVEAIKYVFIIEQYTKNRTVVDWVDQEVGNLPPAPRMKRFYPKELFYAAKVDLKFRNQNYPYNIITCPDIILAFGGTYAEKDGATNSYLYSNIYNQAALRTSHDIHYSTIISCNVTGIGDKQLFDVEAISPNYQFNLFKIKEHIND